MGTKKLEGISNSLFGEVRLPEPMERHQLTNVRRARRLDRTSGTTTGCVLVHVFVHAAAAGKCVPRQRAYRRLTHYWLIIERIRGHMWLERVDLVLPGVSWQLAR